MSYINNFSSDVAPCDNEYTLQDTEATALQIDLMNTFTPTAFTLNNDSEEIAKQLYEELKKYKSLRFITGVLEHQENRKIQENMRKHMERLYGKKIRYEITGGHYEYTIYEFVDTKQQNPYVSLNQQNLLF